MQAHHSLTHSHMYLHQPAHTLMTTQLRMSDCALVAVFAAEAYERLSACTHARVMKQISFAWTSCFLDVMACSRNPSGMATTDATHYTEFQSPAGCRELQVTLLVDFVMPCMSRRQGFSRPTAVLMLQSVVGLAFMRACKLWFKSAHVTCLYF